MKRLLLISMLIGGLSLTAAAQDDDLYFVPKKKAVEKVTDGYGLPRETYYSGSNRSIDEYNRRTSYYEPIESDSTRNDIIDFNGEAGVYPDSLSGDDYQLTRQMSRFDDYDISDNAAFWAGYRAGRDDWGWHSPWYYSRYGWYGGWYDPWYSPWYYTSWRYGWYDPWYYGYYGWYDPWYSPWYYGGWGYRGYYAWGGGWGGGRHHAPTIGAGTIRRDGLSHGSYRRGSLAGSNSRVGTLRDRAVGGHARYGSSRTGSSSSSRNTGSYGSYNRSNSSFSGSRSSSSSSFGGGASRSGGGFSSGGGGSRGGGGGNRMGGRR